MHGALEKAVVVRPAYRDHAVARRLGGDGLKQFLQFAFGIFEDRDCRKPAEGRLEMPENEIAGGIEELGEAYRMGRGAPSNFGRPLNPPHSELVRRI